MKTRALNLLEEVEKKVKKTRNVVKRYKEYHAGDNKLHLSSGEKATYSGAKALGRTARLAFHKYLPKKHQRAGKIAKHGAIGLLLGAPLVKHVASTAGTIAGMRADDRQALHATVKKVIHDPEMRGHITKAAKDYVRDPETLKGVGKEIRRHVTNAVAPMLRLKKIAKPETSPEDAHTGEKFWKDVSDITSTKHTGVHTPIHRISHAAQNDPTFRSLGRIGKEGIKSMSQKSSSNSGSTEIDPEHVSKAANLIHKIGSLPIFHSSSQSG